MKIGDYVATVIYGLRRRGQPARECIEEKTISVI